MEKVLIIDDSKLMLQILSDMLSKEYQVFTLDGGENALGTAKIVRPALVLLDVVMPNRGGFEVIEDLKSDPEIAAIPVIFLTGSAERVDEEHGLALGAVDYITKPFHEGIVRARVRAHINLFVSMELLRKEHERQKLHLKELAHRAETDQLTKLFNRAETKHRVETALAEDHDSVSALILIDVDNFKKINDNLGHQFGDAVLIEVAARLKKLFRGVDTVGRLGGDEFIVFMRSLGNTDIVFKKTEDICAALRQEYGEYNVSASVGISIYPEHADSFDELYRTADLALYESKHLGKNRWTLYDKAAMSVLPQNKTTLKMESSPQNKITPK